MTESRIPQRWRLLLAPPRAAAENMARDSALMERARRTGETVFAVYEWRQPTLSLGRNQIARGRYDPDRIRLNGMEVVRRPTGGRALIHHREITYSVTTSIGAQAGLRNWYQRINRILLHALGAAGIDAMEAAENASTPPLDDAPCFAKPSRGEILAGGRKLVGSAQWRDRGALLQHGSILIDNDQRLIERVSVTPATAPLPSAATLRDLLGQAPTVPEFSRLLFDAVRTLEDSSASTIDEEQVRPAALQRIAEFENQLWTWRR